MHPLRARLPQHDRSVNTPAPGASEKSSSLDSLDLADLLPDVLLFAEAPAFTAEELPPGESFTFELLEGGDSRPGQATAGTRPCGSRHPREPKRRGGWLI
jgi:hypothetical protein